MTDEERRESDERGNGGPVIVLVLVAMVLIYGGFGFWMLFT